jgi:tetratricopeptide (TPR) repeat protein
VPAEYAGKRLGWREFQRVAEEESGQELGWFFEQWVRSSAWADYKIAGQECAGNGGAFDCTVRVRREGTMRMPVTVAARFEDGTEQRATTDRLADENVLRFRAASRLATAVVEPDSAVVMAQAPPPGAAELAEQINALPWTGAGDDALKLYPKLREAGARGEDVPLKVAILLYDGRHYAEALEAFGELEQSKTSMMRFTALVWQGHLLDLLGRRADAIAKYKAALATPGEPKMQHSQYQMTLDKKWVEERIRTPFTR